jgi:hypothetical protein
MSGRYNVDIIGEQLGIESVGKVGDAQLSGQFKDAAVIPLFNDSHLAINPTGVNQSGTVDRVFYNTTEDGTGINLSPRAINLKLTFTSAEVAQKVTGALMDVFLIEPYNSAYWEVHTYAYKSHQVFNSIWDYDKNQQLEVVGYPWAIMVPERDFLYPLEFTPIGSYNFAISGGAYNTTGHKFADWAQMPTVAADWYKYPETSLVFHPSK